MKGALGVWLSLISGCATLADRPYIPGEMLGTWAFDVGGCTSKRDVVTIGRITVVHTTIQMEEEIGKVTNISTTGPNSIDVFFKSTGKIRFFMSDDGKMLIESQEAGHTIVTLGRKVRCDSSDIDLAPITRPLQM